MSRLGPSAKLPRVIPARWLITGCSVNPIESRRIDYVDRIACAKGGDLVEDIRELDFVFFARNVPYVWSADNVVHCEERMLSILKRFLLEDVDGGHPWAALLERADERAGFDQASTAGVDEQSGLFH